MNGKKLKLVTYDTKNDVQEAINAYNRLATQDKAVAIIGPQGNNIGIALAPVAENTKVAILGALLTKGRRRKTTASRRPITSWSSPAACNRPRSSPATHWKN
ncbi:ABC transporter substrate-binding protein [Moorella stamsii]|uniref:ABC transporter substrate-binding protein n=1 Tax=Neomoorella stamsii TaxID=1266720 RepID=UPI0009F9572B